MTSNLHAAIRGVVTAGIIAFGLSSPAFAISNKADCDMAVEKAGQNLLKADISNDKLTEIFKKIDEAKQHCASEDFDGADSVLSKVAEEMEAAPSN